MNIRITLIPTLLFCLLLSVAYLQTRWISMVISVSI